MKHSRVAAEPIEFHGILVSIEWRDLGYDSGIAIRVDVSDGNGRWQEAAKLDAFEHRPHLHVFPTERGEQIEPINLPGTQWCLDLLENLPALLARAGCDFVVDHLEQGEMETALISAVRVAIHSVTPVEHQG